MKRMENRERQDNKEGEKNTHSIEKVGSVVKYIALYIMPILAQFIILFIFYIEHQEIKIEKEESELNSLPQFEARCEEIIPFGTKNFLKIIMENRNEQNVITSGIFTVQYVVNLKTEMDIEAVLIWREIFIKPTVEYDEDLKGCYLFIQDDFLIHEEEVKKLFEEKKIEIVACDSYVFCCFQYIEAGEEKTANYLISLESYKNCKVIVVKDPSVYTNGTLMNP